MAEVSGNLAQLSLEQRIYLENSLLGSVDNAEPWVIPKHKDGAVPLSFAQRQLWYLAQIDPESSAYNQLQVIRLSGSLDVMALQQSVDSLSARHDSLRFCMRKKTEHPELLTKDLPSFEIETLILEQSTSIAREATAWRFCEQWRSEPFNLQEAPLWRIRLIKLGNDEHWLVRVCHHIISDGWSNGLYWSELAQAYTAWIGQKPPQFTALPVCYADYAAWQHNHLRGSELDRLTRYWQQRLAGLETLRLPIDHPRTRNIKKIGKVHSFSLSDELVESIYALVREQDVTLYMVLLGTFQILLHKYTGQSDIAVGSLTANRAHPEIEGLYGLFINTLVMRGDCSDNLIFKDFLAQTKTHVLDAFEHQALPFEKLVEILNPERDSNHNPLYDVVFTLQNMPRNEWTLPDLECDRLEPRSITAKFDMSLAAYETPTGITCQFEYSTALFEDNTITRMAECFTTLLTNAAKSPNLRLSNLSILSKQQMRQLCCEWNDTSVSHDFNLNIVQLFEQQVLATPDRVALKDDSYSMTYEQLNSRANQLAYRLAALGTEAHSVVGVLLARSIDVSVAVLAIFKLGAVYLPLDSSYPAGRLAKMLATTRADSLVTRADINTALEWGHSKRVLLDDDNFILDKLPTTNLGTTSKPGDPAYIIFTSGSTASPKGVCATHRQILNRLHWMWRSYPFSEHEVSCQKTAISFVDSLWEILGPLLVGSPSVVMHHGLNRDPRGFLDFLQHNRVTRLWVVPTLLQLLADTAAKSHHQLPFLEMLVSSGEILTGRLASDVRKIWPNTRLYNLYGTSEAWDSTWHRVTPEDEQALQVPVGKPIDNVQIHILDSHLNPVPVGVAGQLFVKGIGLADHFIEAADIPTDGFVELPWGIDSDQIKATRMHASGDHALYRPDGSIVILGRESSEMNVRGYRVNPAEIEQAITSVVGVEQALVVQSTNQLNGQSGDQLKKQGQILVAFVILHHNRSISAETIETHIFNNLKLKLPVYMMPNRIVFMDSFPTTPSGKLDRGLLTARADSLQLNPHHPENEHSTGVGESHNPPAQSNNTYVLKSHAEIEKKILHVWKSLLPAQTINTGDNFFDIGGHSLLAVELFDKLQKLSSVPLEISSLYEASTIADQARLIAKLRKQCDYPELVTIRNGRLTQSIYLIPPSAGTGLNYRKLSETLDDDHSVYTFNMASYRRSSMTFNRASGQEFDRDLTVESIAADFIAALTHQQPTGPYILGGMCFGGLIAWEMTRQLQQAGEQVSRLILLDSSQPFHGPDWNHQKNIQVSLQEIILNHIKDIILHRFSRRSLYRVFRKGIYKALRPFNRRLQEFRDMRLEDNNAWLIYKAEPLEVDVLLICSSEFHARKNYIKNWQILVKGLLGIKILDNTTHFEMLTDDRKKMEQAAHLINQYLQYPVGEQSDTDVATS